LKPPALDRRRDQEAAALFTFSYEGVGEDEALQLADKFDWKAL
jgi:hypothetical protein